MKRLGQSFWRNWLARLQHRIKLHAPQAAAQPTASPPGPKLMPPQPAASSTGVQHTSLAPLRPRSLMAIATTVMLMVLLLVWQQWQPRPLLEQVMREGQLKVLVVPGPATFQEREPEPNGLEYTLLRLYAEHLGVRLETEVAATAAQALALLSRGEAHLAAAWLTPESQAADWHFGPSFHESALHVVWRPEPGRKSPRGLKDIKDQLAVSAGGAAIPVLRRARSQLPELEWREEPLATDELLHHVWAGLLDYAVASGVELDLARRIYPELASAFELAPAQPVAWAVAEEDGALLRSLEGFMALIRQNGVLEYTLSQYSPPKIAAAEGVTQQFIKHAGVRLEHCKPLFEEAARETGLDWKLLAAIGYQESQWNIKAVSPTGVKGIMMLTKDTAAQLGVSDREDPKQSILGGARYFKELYARLPERIEEPDRTWFALAAYNVGLGHLEDARVLTAKQGGDPDDWQDVRQHLPLLSHPEWHPQTKHGYARGREPVVFVNRVRQYHELLEWFGSTPQPVNEQEPAAPDLTG
jgi:membrane-bound lytic murein transglycosylase F